MADVDHATHAADAKKGAVPLLAAGGAAEDEKNAGAARGDAMDVDEAKRAAGGGQEIDLEEKRRLDHLESMDKIEKEFSEVKEKLFQEKMTSLDDEIKKVEAGTHERLLIRMKELQQSKEEKLQAAEQWRQYMLQQAAAVFESEKKQADDEYDNDKLNLKEELLQLLQERQKKLEEEKNNLILADGAADAGGDSRAPNPRSLRRRGGGKETLATERIKKKPSLPPHINYLLKDTEVQEDLAAISKSYIPSGRDARGKANEIFADKGIFHYHEREFEKGSMMTVQAARDPAAPKEKEPESWTGVVTFVSPAEVQVKTGDGARQRFTVSQLRSGKYLIV